MPSSAAPAPTHLDSLLTTYLSVLDSYTSLRTELSTEFSSAFISLAQARFRAPPAAAHVGFGAVLADGGRRGRGARMAVTIEAGESEDEAVDEGDGMPGLQVNVYRREEKAEQETKEKTKKSKVEDEKDDMEVLDPLRLFGFVAPSGLKECQGAFERTVHDAVRLVVLQRRLVALEGRIEREKQLRREREE